MKFKNLKMKTKILVLAALVLLIVAAYFGKASAQKNKFPQIININEHKAGDLITESGFSKNKWHKEYQKKIPTTYGIIVVRENRNNPDSRLITLPVKKLHSFSKTPKEPIFLLFGGPGSSNIKKAPYLWLLENHDVVMLGYRGVDGSVSLQSPEIPAAMVVEGNPFSEENTKKISEAALTAFNRLKNEGIDMALIKAGIISPELESVPTGMVIATKHKLLIDAKDSSKSPAD